MGKTIRAMLAGAIATIALLSTFAVASAQSPLIATGVVAEVETDDDGELNAFSIIIGSGAVIRFTVAPSTEYGLENRVGERWVSDQSADPKEAAIRLTDQQRRLTQISVQADDGGVATSVVQAESADIDSNLGYLFAVVAIAWITIMAYVVYIGVRQRTMAADLARIGGDNEDDDVS
jgi:CcmD family protein